MGTFTERLQILVDASSKGLVSGMKEGETATTGLASKFPGLSSLTSRFGVESNALGTAMKVGIAGGAIAAGAGLAKMALDGVQAFASATAEVRAYQRVTLDSAENSSKLVAAMKRLSIDSDAGSSAMGKFAKAIGTGTFEGDKFGVTIAKNADGTVNMADTLLNLSDKFAGMTDATARAELGAAAFGKGWQTLLPLLGKGRDGLQEFYDEAAKNHEIFSDSDLEKGRQYNLAMKDLTAAFHGLEIELGSAVIPMITDMAHTITEAVHQVDAMSRPLGGLGNALGVAFDATPAGNLKLAVGGASDVLHGRFIPGLEKSVLSAVPFGGAIGHLTGLLGGGSDASDKFTDAQKRQSEAMQKVATLAADSSTKHSELKAAQDELEHSSSALATVQDRVQEAVGAATKQLDAETEAQKTAAKAADDHKKSLDDLQATLLGAAGGEIAHQQALIGLEKAQNDVNDAIAQNGPDSLAARDAQLALQQAQLGVAQSSIDLAANTDHLTGTFGSNYAAIQEEIAHLTDVKNRYGDTGGAIQVTIDKLQAMADKINGGFTGTIDGLKGNIDSMAGAWVNASGSLSGYLALLNPRAVADANAWGDVESQMHTNPLVGQAGGGQTVAPGLSWVGEGGRELRYMPAGAQVIPHGASESIAAAVAGGGGGPGQARVVINLDGQTFLEVLADLDRQGYPTPWN